MGFLGVLQTSGGLFGFSSVSMVFGMGFLGFANLMFFLVFIFFVRELQVILSFLAFLVVPWFSFYRARAFFVRPI